MKIKFSFVLGIVALLLGGLTSFVAAQTGAPLIKRTDYKTDRFDFGVGGMVSVIGAPEGSITIEGWANREIEIAAEITNEAATEADLALLSKINGFAVDDSFGKVRVVSVGTHDKKYLKKLDQKLPKNLAGAPFRIDYKIKVPFYTDLEINGGKGDFSLSGVEGTFRINLLESDASFDLVGGALDATIGTGTVDVQIASRSWRGRAAVIQLASGTMNVFLPLNFNADLDAEVLRTGRIENAYDFLKPRERRAQFTDKQIVAKTGTGGVPLKFTVGDGTLNLAEYKIRQAQK